MVIQRRCLLVLCILLHPSHCSGYQKIYLPKKHLLFLFFQFTNPASFTQVFTLCALTAGGWIAVMILIIVILFGGFLCMTGGDNSSTVSSVSAEVEAYEPLIRQNANQYGIGEYVELIKAIMMQESGGRGLDPMQCSEGSFNTIQNIPDSQMESQIQSIRFLVVCRK